MEWIPTRPSGSASLTLVALEIVLGIDNLIFIAILADKLPPDAARPGSRPRAVVRSGDAPGPAGEHHLDDVAHRAAVQRSGDSSFRGAT